MKSRILRVALLGVLVVSTESTPAVDAEKSGGWTQIFNGKNLEGWTPKITGFPLGTNYADTFRVEDGALKVSYAGYTNFGGRFGHLFWKERLTNYVLRIEYRFTGNQVAGGPGWAFRNSGVMLHCEDPRGMDVGQDFPTSLEAQMLGGPDTGKRTTLNLCTPGTDVVMDGKLTGRHCTESSSKTYPGDQWVTAEIEVHGSKLIKHIVEGETVLTYTLPQLDEKDVHARKLIPADGNKLVSSGYISLQAESHPVEFRKVELKILSE
jgi:hypothetical protein